MPTLADIANEVGVSSKTVSLTLRGKKCASPDTTERILAVAEKTGYLRYRQANARLANGPACIGFLSDDVVTSPHTVELLRGAQAEAIEQEQLLLIGSLDRGGEIGADFLRMFRANKVYGVVYATLFRHEIPEISENMCSNIIYANCFITPHETKSILPDDEAGGYRQAEHLLRLGHQRIGVLTLPTQAPATSLRMKGIARAFVDHGVPLDLDLCCSGVEGYLPVGETYVAYERAIDMLERDDRPTAIICGNDRIALMVYGAAAHLGLRIPQDLSVIGFDDFETITEVVRPRLTSIKLPYYEMGRQAVRAILYGEESGALFAPIACPLIDRESTAPLSS